MKYIQYPQKKITKKITSNEKLDEYLLNIGFTSDHINYILNCPNENDLHLMHDMDKMLDEIKNLSKETVFTIVSDYDADGVTSNSILYLVLTKIGFKVNYYVPHRIYDGYGLSIKIVDKILEEYPETNIIITCDNGIAAVDAVSYAKSKGFKVYVTDHHTPDMNNLPKEADYIVHPALPGYPFPHISGATVAYKVAKGLLETFNIMDKKLEEYITQLAAISIVSDVMPVANKELELMKVNENRTILKKGLELMRTNPDWRLETMFDMFKIQKETLDETTIGFYIAPVINAVGRLDSAAEAVAFLTADNKEVAILKCSIMGYLNEERKLLKAQALNSLKDTIDITKPSIIVKSDKIHEGIVGIIAGNLCEQYQKPTIVFSKMELNGEKAWKASARSIEGVNLYELLSEINGEKPEVIYTFGGHSGAAGLTVLDSHFDEFEKMFNKKVENLGELESNKYFMYILSSDLDEFAKSLLEIKPLGEGLPKPVIKTTMFINQYDFFYKSSHVKLSNCFGNELWLYNSLNEFSTNNKNMENFYKVMDNTEKKMATENISRREAKSQRWERWESKRGEKPLFDIISELDYGNFMNKVDTIHSVIQYERR